ncbi:MAG TPA: type II toxin-antitoxin system VapC family toxin [Verrucomicrobiae bacterium]|jgi:predicted nucleic acid-binding protein|nr:type II toxin-antitoxin system VapC family toxin [Verrucomicrobiae bacterium]
MIHFDTNFLIQATVAGSPSHFQFRGWASTQEILAISSIAWAEFLCGPLDAKGESLARQIFPNPEPFLSADAALAANLFNQTGRRSRSLADCMIAAVAIRSGAKLATINATDFQPFNKHGLVLA